MKKTVLEYWRLVKLAFWCVFNVREADRYFREHGSFQKQLNVAIDSCETLNLENAELKNTLYLWENGLAKDLQNPPVPYDSKKLTVAGQPATIEWDSHDKIFVATADNLVGCSTHGKTFEEAEDMLVEAIDLYLRLEASLPKPEVVKTKKKASKKKTK